MRGRRVERVPLLVGRALGVEPVSGSTQAALYGGLATTSTCRGRSKSCRSGSARSTFIGSTRTSGSSSPVGRGAPRALRPAGRPRPRPVRRLGHHARPVPRVGLRRGGVDVAGFNCLLMRAKTARYDLFRLETEVRDVLERGRLHPGRRRLRRRVVRARRSGAAPLLPLLVGDYEHADVFRVVLARAARSARLTTHFDLDFPRAPQREPYWCHKHRRQCAPVQEARSSSPLPPRHARADQGVPQVRARGPVADGRARRFERLEARRAFRRDRDVAAVSGAHRLPRAAPLCVRAPRSRRSARPRDRRRVRSARAGGRSRRTSTGWRASSEASLDRSSPMLP